MNRRAEIRLLNALETEELARQGGKRLIILEDLDALHRHFADSLAELIANNNSSGCDTTLILPVGPTGQYPVFVEIINEKSISLERCTFLFMDEYADSGAGLISESHPLSFRRQTKWIWESIRADLRPAKENVIFPGPDTVEDLPSMIQARGGIDVCYGGIGIHGHIAFNEPEAGVRHSGCRLVRLNEYTITMNAIRSGVGGDLENFPRYAWTLGLKQCLSAARIRLYCRNDVQGLDWANTVLRLALLGTPGDDYPVTWIREHADWQVITDRLTAAPPRFLL